MSISKVRRTFRLSRECRCLLRAIADHFGVGMTAVIEMAVREMATRLGVKAAAVPDDEEEGE